MQHSIDTTQLGDRAPAITQAIQSCVHCGLCLAVCPTYQVLGEEMNSPRGRIVLMKSALEGSIAIEEAAPYVDRCLGCVACVSACPSGVSYGDLLLSYRILSERESDRPWSATLARKMVVETLPYPQRFRSAVRVGRWVRSLQPFLPGALAGMAAMVPDTLPASTALPPLFPAEGKVRARVALLVGCVQHVLNPAINWATLRVLAANGVETIIPQGQGCCGAILMHVGQGDRALELARNNMAHFPVDVDAIVTNAAGCSSGMHEYPLLFQSLADEADAQTFSDRTMDISVFLDQLGLIPPPPLARPLRVAYHDACHLLHAQGIQDEPRRILASIPNLTLLELSDGGLCCGSAGTYNLEHSEIADELGQRKVERILHTRAEAVITGNIGCYMQIQTHMNRHGQVLPIYHTVELLDQAYLQR